MPEQFFKVWEQIRKLSNRNPSGWGTSDSFWTKQMGAREVRIQGADRSQ
jgi:hypothetical protein